MKELLENTVHAFISFYLIFYYLFIVVCIAVRRNSKRASTPSYRGGISVLVPCFNEVLTIKETIQSIIECKHDFRIEIIVIDDGIDSATKDYLKTQYSFTSSSIPARGRIPSKRIRSVEMATISGIPCYLIDKDNGRKADALNAGINLAHFEYFLCLDGDTLLDKKALLSLHRHITEKTLAIGGRVLPILPDNLGLKENFYTIAQLYEYARTFSITRVAYSAFNAVPLLSGAISLFHTDTVRQLGGYYVNTKGEDFELTLRLQQVAQSQGGLIQYIPSAIVYTQVPFDFLSIVRQRTRWQQGMFEVFSLHRDMFRQPTRLSVVLHHMRLYEKYGCIIEFLLFLTLQPQFLPFIFDIFLLGILFTLYAANISMKKPPVSLFILFIFAPFFHYMNSIIKCTCLFRKNKPSWGSPRRMEIKV